MNLIKKIAVLSLSAVIGLTTVTGCTPESSITPSIEPTHSEEASPSPTVPPTLTPSPSHEPDAVPVDAHYIIKDGKACITFVYAEDAAEPIKSSYQQIQDYISEKNGVLIQCRTDAQLSKVKNEKFFVGNTKKTDISLMSNDATWYDCLLTQTEDGLVAMAYTQGGIINAMEYFKESLIFSNNDKDVYFTPDTLKLYDRNNIREMKHAFDKFTISGYGLPTFNNLNPADWDENDKATYQTILDFGIDHIAVNFAGMPKGSVEDTRAFINKFYEDGITSRYYFDRPAQCEDEYIKYGEEYYIESGRYLDIENAVKKAIADFGDMEAVTEWGFYDEPHFTDAKKFCGFVMRLFDENDPDPNRRVYINMDPSDTSGYFDDMVKYIDPDYYCYDRYPFFFNEDGQPQMTDKYYYANLELNRNYAIDAGRDSGLIIGSILVGNDHNRSDITKEYMSWQINCLLAYNSKYVEHFVFWAAHEGCLYVENNERTFRWYIAQEANKYLRPVGDLLFDKKLDAVFHLQNADGTYSAQTVAYKGYGNIGEVTGCDAFLSFFDDGTIILTDKRSSPADGTEHDITLSGLSSNVEWFNASTNSWEDISTCNAAAVDENGLTFTLQTATQYIIRIK